MRVRLTDDRARKVVPHPTRTTFVRDADLVGFGLRVTATGAKSWIVEGKAAGRSVRRTIARAERLTASEARAKARKLLATMSEGNDPLVAARAGRSAAVTLLQV